MDHSSQSDPTRLQRSVGCGADVRACAWSNSSDPIPTGCRHIGQRSPVAAFLIRQFAGEVHRAHRSAGLSVVVVLVQRSLGLEDAQLVITAVVDEAKQKNWRIAVVVVDRTGELIACARMDGRAARFIKAAYRTAYTAAVFEMDFIHAPRILGGGAAASTLSSTWALPILRRLVDGRSERRQYRAGELLSQTAPGYSGHKQAVGGDVSSRVLPYEPATGRPADGVEQQARFLFENIQRLLAAGGADGRHITQGRLSLANPSCRDMAIGYWRALVGAAQSEPVLQITPYRLAPALLVMLEIIARPACEQLGL
jgi:Haem-degrading